MSGIITKKIVRFCVTLPFALVFTLSLPHYINAWDLAKEGDGIKVYTKKIEGSDFKAYRAVMLVKSKIPTLVKLIKDIPAYPLWIDTCEKGVLLKELGENECIVYTLNHAPWPVSNRDAVVLNTVSYDSKEESTTIKIQGKHSYIPITNGIIRVKKIKGFWKFVPQKNGFTEVIYQVHSEPGGNIPSWLLNQIVVSQPFNTLKNMKEMLSRPEYNKAGAR